MKIEIAGGAGPQETAAIMAAIARFVEEEALLAAIPPVRPAQGRWVLSGRPRPVSAPAATRPAPTSDGWSVGSEEETGF